MDILCGTTTSLSNDLITRLGRYRHRVFVETLQWDLPARDGLEFDQFDRPDTYYLAVRRGDTIVGSGRLLPTDKPYLLQEVFPELMGGLPLPQDPRVWELSRFAALDLDARPEGSADGQFSSPATLMLLRAALAFAASHGVQRLITVSPLGVERLLRRTGIVAYRAAPPKRVGGHLLFACWIEVPQPSDG